MFWLLVFRCIDLSPGVGGGEGLHLKKYVGARQKLWENSLGGIKIRFLGVA